jgi:hypothetical protein
MSAIVSSDLQRRLGLSDEEIRQLETLAAEGDRSVLAEVRRAIRAHLEKENLRFGGIIRSSA